MVIYNDDHGTGPDREMLMSVTHLLHVLRGSGDQVLEWNGRVLQGATFNEVYNIILESKPEPQVELVVSRPIGWVKGLTGVILQRLRGFQNMTKVFQIFYMASNQ